MFDDRPDIQERLDREVVIWMTTVNAAGQAQASPVWYIVSEDAIVVYSHDKIPRTRNIAANQKVAMQLNSSKTGGDLVIIEGEAEVILDGLAADQNPAYLDKYKGAIARMNMTAQSFSHDYPVRIHVRPTRLRGS